MCGWQVKLCDPFVTHGPYLSAWAVVLAIIRRYTNHQITLTLWVAKIHRVYNDCVGCQGCCVTTELGLQVATGAQERCDSSQLTSWQFSVWLHVKQQCLLTKGCDHPRMSEFECTHVDRIFSGGGEGCSWWLFLVVELMTPTLPFRTLLLVLSPEHQNLLTSLLFLNLYTGSK